MKHTPILLAIALVAMAAAATATAQPLAKNQPGAAKSVAIERATVERLRSGRIGPDMDALRRELQEALAADCASLGGEVIGFSTEAILRSDGDYEVNAELNCRID